MNDQIDEFLQAISTPVQDERRQGNPAQASYPDGGGDWAKTLASASCWAQAGSSYFPVNDVVKSVPAGAYRCRMSQTGPYIEKMKIEIDHLLKLPDSNVEILLNEFSQFWKLRKSFDERGFTFKRGMLMWGPPGSGKTSGVWQMTQRLIQNNDGIVVFIEDPQIAIWCLTMLRRIEPKRSLITVMEDIDAIIAQHGEHHLLALLDGEFQIDNVVHVATTNYPHMLDKRFIDRPSRFDTIMKVGMPSAEAREVYFKAKEPSLDDVTIERWVENTEGYSVAHLREVCIAIKCFEQKESEVFDRLNKMKEVIHLNDDGVERQQAGFLSAQLGRMQNKRNKRQL